MILYLEKKSDTGFHNHMWKTLKGKLDGIAKAVWRQELPPCILNSPQNTGGGWGSFTQLFSTTTAKVNLAGNMQKLAGLECC